MLKIISAIILAVTVSCGTAEASRNHYYYGKAGWAGARRTTHLSPNDVTGLRLWVDGSKSAVTKDGSNLTSAWNDLSGNNYHLAQAGADGIKPVYTINSQGGRPCMVTTGGSQYMTSAAALSDVFANNAKTAFFVVSSASFSAAAQERFFVDTGDIMRFIADTETITKFKFLHNDGGGLDANSQDNPVLNTPYVLTFQHNGTNLLSRINGGNLISAASGNTSNLTGTLSVMGRAAGNGYQGKFCSMALFNVVIPDGNRVAVTQYFRRYWRF